MPYLEPNYNFLNLFGVFYKMIFKKFKTYHIKRISQVTTKTLKELSVLLLQWRKGTMISLPYLRLLLKKSYMLGLYCDSKIIGIVTLVPAYKVSGRKGFVEHLIVDEKYRGRGLGKQLMLSAIALGKKLKMDTLFLTCSRERVVANSLYKKLGFKIKETNFYQLKMEK